jgi:hypothetical protein
MRVYGFSGGSNLFGILEPFRLAIGGLKLWASLILSMLECQTYLFDRDRIVTEQPLSAMFINKCDQELLSDFNLAKMFAHCITHRLIRHRHR